MSRSNQIIVMLALGALAAVGSACSRGADEAELAADGKEGSSEQAVAEDVGEPTAEPTIVRRIEPTPTPTVDPKAEPFYAVMSEELEGVPVPIGADLVEFVEATDDGDARADYVMQDTDDDAIAAWFLEQMPEHGWDEGDERDGGGLVFLHGEQLSGRYASEGLKRTATVILDTFDDNVDFSLLVEAPAE